MLVIIATGSAPANPETSGDGAACRVGEKGECSMEIGKVPENVLKRAVFKQIRRRRPEVPDADGDGAVVGVVVCLPTVICCGSAEYTLELT